MAIAERLARGRIYYGWYIVALSFVLSFAGGGLFGHSSGVFLKPMTEELGWSRAFYSFGVSIGGLLSGPVSLLVGPVIDRRGGRGLLILGGLTMGMGAMALALISAQWHFLGLRAILGLGNIGQLVAQVAVANWFIRRRGRALAITTMGLSTSGTVTPLWATYLISTLGWRQAWVVMGLVALVLIVFPATLFMKRRPEDMGLVPDGAPAPSRAGPERPAFKPEVSWSRRQALKTPAFWLIVMSIPMGVMGISAVNAHLYAYLTDIEFSRQTAAMVSSTVYLTALFIKPFWGFVSERIPARHCLAAIFVQLSLGMGLLVVVGPNLTALFLIAILLGIGFGGHVPLQGLIWANYFGRTSLGRVRSLATLFQVVITPVGPILAGRIFDVTGSYMAIFTAFIGVQLVAALLIFLARPPRLPEASLSLGKALG